MFFFGTQNRKPCSELFEVVCEHNENGIRTHTHMNHHNMIDILRMIALPSE